jgi:hypothetical protein
MRLLWYTDFLLYMRLTDSNIGYHLSSSVATLEGVAQRVDVLLKIEHFALMLQHLDNMRFLATHAPALPSALAGDADGHSGLKPADLSSVV